MGDHTETVQVDYDPKRISYGQLLDIFWESHQPTSRNWSRQYMNVVFSHDERQRESAMVSKSRKEQERGQKFKTKVLPVRTFTMAADFRRFGE